MFKEELDNFTDINPNPGPNHNLSPHPSSKGGHYYFLTSSYTCKPQATLSHQERLQCGLPLIWLLIKDA